MASLKYVMLLIKDVPKAAKFYSEGLGMRMTLSTERWAELQSPCGTGVKIALKAVESEAAATPGYSPFLSFEVQDLDNTVYRLLALGAALDGPIKYPDHGKVAALRAPDGHMIGLFEPTEKS